jgi:hypothetical protein
VHDAARVDDARHEHRGLVSDDVTQWQRPERVALPCDRRFLLDSDEEAVQGPWRIAAARISSFRHAGLSQRLLVERLGERVDRRLDGLGPGDHSLGQLHGRQFARAEEAERLRR